MAYVTYKCNIPIRLDRYLNINYKITHGIIEKFLRKGLIKVSGCKCKANLRLNKGVTVYIADSIVNGTSFRDRAKKKKNQFSNKIINFTNKYFSSWVIYEDKNIIAINKPGNISTQGGTNVDLSIDHILQYLNHTTLEKFRLVHRLDKKTSGILLIAKNRKSAIKLTKAFKESKIKKIYIAVLKGVVLKEKGTITSIIDGKKSITNYFLVKQKSPDINLVIFKPITGRKHQLRKHALELGCRIIGDSSKKNEPMLLHALEISIDKEVMGSEITIKTEIPKIFDI